MYNKNNYVVIIPARGGSKRLPGKNIIPLKGKPVIAYTIQAACQSKYVDRVIVSTDDAAIAEAARIHGAEVPFVRPANLATDEAKSIDVLKHAVNFLEQNGQKVDVVVLIQPTSPLVIAEDIDRAIEKQSELGTNSCVSVCEISERPEWMYELGTDGRAVPFLSESDNTKRSQEFKKIYRLNGAVYVSKRDVIMEKNACFDVKSLSAIVMPKERSVDIDDKVDLKLAEALLP